MVTGRIIIVLLLSSAAPQNPMRKSVRYGSGVGDNEPVTWSHAGNTLSPVPLSPSFLSPLVRPASFLRTYPWKEKVANEGFLGPGAAPVTSDETTTYDQKNLRTTQNKSEKSPSVCRVLPLNYI